MVEQRGTRDMERMRQSTSGVPDLRFHGTIRGLFQAAALASLAGVLACSGSAKQTGEEPDPSGAATEPGTEDGADKPADHVEPTIELGPITKGSFREHPAGVAFVFEDDPENPKKMDIGEAEARGYTIVDLSDDWVPYIFSEKTAGADDEQDNTYREKYIGLANNKIDLWGDELDDHERNYLELYGIPPTLSVIQNEWNELESEVVPCLEAAGYDRSVFGTFDGTIVFKKAGQSKRNKSARWYQAKVEKAMKKAKLDPENPDDMAAAATHPKTKKIYKKWREFADEVDVIDHAQRRFRCEKMFNGGDGTGKFDEGVYDSPTTHALANFERKHDIMGWGHFKSDNVGVLAMEPAQAQYERMKRVLAERVVISAGILEDGSAREWKHSKKKGHWKYKDTEGNEHELRDLATEYTDALVAALGMDTPEAAKQRLAALSDLGQGFDGLLVAVKMPEKPPYYSDNMAFSTIIDRGDVWYDFPYDEVGNKVGQPRRRPTQADALRRVQRPEDPDRPLGHDHRFVAQRDQGRRGHAQVQELRRRAAGLEGHHGRAGVDSAGEHPGGGAHPRTLAQRQVQTRRRLPHHRSGLSLGVRPGRRVPHQAGRARRRNDRRVRQRHPDPRQRRLHVDPPPLFTRLPPALQHERGAHVLVHPAASRVQP